MFCKFMLFDHAIFLLSHKRKQIIAQSCAVAFNIISINLLISQITTCYIYLVDPASINSIHHVLCRRAASRASGYFFLGSIPKDDEPVKLNGALFHSLCTILPFVAAASSAEAELGTFLNMKEARIFRLKLEELVHLPASDTYASLTPKLEKNLQIGRLNYLIL